jgi:hypothetical protein
VNAWKETDQGKPTFTDTEIKEIAAYIAGLPTAADIDKMSTADKKAFADQRRWALVYYALSLSTNTRSSPPPPRAGFASR